MGRQRGFLSGKGGTSATTSTSVLLNGLHHTSTRVPTALLLGTHEDVQNTHRRSYRINCRHLGLTALLITSISTFPSTSRRTRDSDARLDLTGTPAATPAAESPAGVLSRPGWTRRSNHSCSSKLGCRNVLEHLNRSMRLPVLVAGDI